MNDLEKSKLTKRYRTEMKLKAEAKMKQQKLGTVQQMWEQGYSYEEMEENLLSMVLPEGDTIGYHSEASDQE
jgi:phosphodiesterase/alkaline phosphatase D-like protein